MKDGSCKGDFQIIHKGNRTLFNGKVADFQGRKEKNIYVLPTAGVRANHIALLCSSIALHFVSVNSQKDFRALT
jgi:hypothetical protein